MSVSMSSSSTLQARHKMLTAAGQLQVRTPETTQQEIDQSASIKIIKQGRLYSMHYAETKLCV